MAEKPRTIPELQAQFEKDFAESRKQANDLQSLEGMRRRGGKQGEAAKRIQQKRLYDQK